MLNALPDTPKKSEASSESKSRNRLSIVDASDETNQGCNSIDNLGMDPNLSPLMIGVLRHV